MRKMSLIAKLNDLAPPKRLPTMTTSTPRKIIQQMMTSNASHTWRG